MVLTCHQGLYVLNSPVHWLLVGFLLFSAGLVLLTRIVYGDTPEVRPFDFSSTHLTYSWPQVYKIAGGTFLLTAFSILLGSLYISFSNPGEINNADERHTYYDQSTTAQARVLSNLHADIGCIRKTISYFTFSKLYLKMMHSG